MYLFIRSAGARGVFFRFNFLVKAGSFLSASSLTHLSLWLSLATVEHIIKIKSLHDTMLQLNNYAHIK